MFRMVCRRLACLPAVVAHLTAETFLRLRRDGNGGVSAATLAAYLGSCAAMLQLVDPWDLIFASQQRSKVEKQLDTAGLY